MSNNALPFVRVKADPKHASFKDGQGEFQDSTGRTIKWENRKQQVDLVHGDYVYPWAVNLDRTNNQQPYPAGEYEFDGDAFEFREGKLGFAKLTKLNPRKQTAQSSFPMKATG